MPKTDEHHRIFSYVLTKDMYVIGGPINNGGIVLKWFKNNFCQEEIKEAAQANRDVYDLINSIVETIEPGSNNLICLPFLLGERAPYWNTQVKGMFFGLDLNHTKAHMLRSIMEGIIYNIYSVGESIQDLIGEIDVIYASGGFSKSEPWIQILADIFNKEIRILLDSESACLGAVIVALKSLNIIANLNDFKKNIPSYKIVTPNQKNKTKYDNLFKIYKELYQLLKPEFIKLLNIE